MLVKHRGKILKHRGRIMHHNKGSGLRINHLIHNHHHKGGNISELKKQLAHMVLQPEKHLKKKIQF